MKLILGACAAVLFAGPGHATIVQLSDQITASPAGGAPQESSSFSYLLWKTRVLDPNVNPQAQTITTLSLEGLPLSKSSAVKNGSLTVALGGGVTAVMTNVAESSGLVTGNTDVIYGYNTTPGGSEFFRLVPGTDGTLSTLTLRFDQPVDNFALFMTGVGTDTGALSVSGMDFSDRPNTVIRTGFYQDIPGNKAGGLSFYSLRDAGNQISEIRFSLYDPKYRLHDVIGFDDLSFTHTVQSGVPEPSSWLMMISGFGIVGVASRRARRSAVRLAGA